MSSEIVLPSTSHRATNAISNNQECLGNLLDNSDPQLKRGFLVPGVRIWMVFDSWRKHCLPRWEKLHLNYVCLYILTYVCYRYFWVDYIVIRFGFCRLTFASLPPFSVFVSLSNLVPPLPDFPDQIISILIGSPIP